MKRLIEKLNELEIIVKPNNGLLDIYDPKDNLSEELVNDIRINKDKLLNFFKQINSGEIQTIPLSEKREYYETLPGQELVYIDHESTKGNCKYNIPNCFKIEGRIDLDKFQTSFIKLIERHAILRTSFHIVNGKVVQKVEEQTTTAGIQIKRVEDGNSIEEELKALILPFSLDQAPLARMTILNANNNENYLFIDMHHIISDGTSFNVFLSEFKSLLLSNEIENHSLQFLDYVIWKNNQYRNNRYKKQELFWIDKFKNGLSVPEIPKDVIPKGSSVVSSSYKNNLNEDVKSEIEAFCNENEITISMFMLSVYAILLSKLCESRELVIGLVNGGRNEKEIEKCIGYFVNVLPCQLSINQETNFQTFITSEVKQNLLEALDNQDVSIDKIIEKSAHLQSKNGAIYTATFVMQNFDQVNFSLNETNIERIQIPGHNNNKFDLSFTGYQLEKGIGYSIDYDIESFTNETIGKYGELFKHITNQVISNPSVLISDIELVNTAELNKIEQEFDLSSIGYPNNVTILDYFQKQVENVPNNIAITFEGEQLTYKELDQKSDILCNILFSKGIKPQSIVTILLEKSTELIVSILAVLKSGGIYMPIDPTNPIDRIEFIIKNSNSKWVISREKEFNEFDFGRLADCFDESITSNEVINSNIILADTLDKYPLENDFERERPIISPSDIAYVIYTSGTTGNPKGVLVSHENVVRLFFNDKPLFDFNANDVWTLFHNPNFDFSVWEMYGALLFGGELIIVSKETARDTQLFIDTMVEKKVTILNQTPSAFYNLAKVVDQSNVRRTNLRYVIFGGEALSPFKLKKWHQTFPNIKLINMFGITETCVHVTYKEIKEKDINNQSSNIGKPIPTLKTYVLNNDKKHRPPGIQGELYVGGAGVARGYLNNVELTHEKFLKLGNSDDLLYASGDVVKINKYHELVYINRKDKQVQVRGFRIEPDEIVFHLLKHDKISNAIVIPISDNKSVNTNENDTVSLCVYYESGSELDINSLKSFLSKKLPDYYIPSFFVYVSKFPLTPNGKLDFNQLPNPYSLATSDAQPRNENEELLLNIWKETLNIDALGIDDGFFNYGGDSIKAIQVLSSINNAFDINLSLYALYENDTISKLAAVINNTKIDNTNHQRDKVLKEIASVKNQVMLAHKQPEIIEDVYPMSDIELGMNYHYVVDAESHTYHDHYSFEFSLSDFDSNLFKKTHELIAEKHNIFRSAFNDDEFDRPVRIIYKEVKVDYTYSDISSQNNDQKHQFIKQIISDDYDSPYNLKVYPLWKVHVIKLDADYYYYFLSCPHSILDGWSNTSFMVELTEIYYKLADDVNYRPPLLMTSYKETVIEELRVKRDENYKNFWKAHLKDHKKVRFDILDKDKVNNLMPQLRIDFGENMYEKLYTLSQKLEIPIKNICFAAYIYALKLFTNQNQLTVGIVSNIRPIAEDGEKILGCFLNTLPIAINLHEQFKNWKQYLEHVNEVYFGVQKYDRLSLNEIGMIMNDKAGKIDSLFDTLFNFMDFHNIYDSLTDTKKKSFINTRRSYDIEIFNNTNTVLDVEVNITRKRLVLLPKYNPAYFPEQFIRNYCECYKNLLSEFIHNTEGVIDNNVLMAADEKEQVISTFNNTSKAFSSNTTLKDVLEDSVIKHPNNIAVESSEHKLTYAQLNKKANKICSTLHHFGVNTNQLVGILMERTPEMICSVLGVIKSGGTYVPLEINQPKNRIKELISRNKINYVITTSSQLNQFKEIIEEDLCDHIFCLDDNIDTELNAQKITFPYKANFNDPTGISISPSQYAYVIFTSGTTGTPKGVIVEHKKVVNVVEWVNNEFNVNSNDKVLFVSSLAFDLSVYDIFGILSKGGTLRILSNEEMAEPEVILKTILNDKITIWNSAPAFMQQITPFFNTVGSDNAYSNLRLVLLSGDWIPLTLPTKLKESFAKAEVISLGGATEATVWSNYYKIGDINKNWKSIPYGKPIQNAKYYVLNESLEPCNIGVSGDLYIGGECLASGYLNDPELTSSKFIPSPFNDNELIYKTGDLSKWHFDGNLEFLGRNDNQVKVRGYRIELGEIEHHLLKYEGIENAIVVLLHQNGEPFLSAYYIGKTDIDPEQIKTHLSKHVPKYMVANYYTKIEEIPLSNNGKLDRTKLPLPGLEKAKTITPPANETEENIAEIWSEILNINTNEIGANSDFFELGGNSLNVARLTNRIHKTFGKKLPITTIFNYSKLSEIANLLLIDTDLAAKDQDTKESILI